ncbi:MAG TPA: TetR/AcrR family transcriptional regulator, partial [Mycobacterium sp.]|nr:TetR/AcrR family transcriptional regulator [Mycobacterium sp.]
ASTMQVIAREAGYTRAVLYRHFVTRDKLLDALVLRVALRKMAQIAGRLQGTVDPNVLVVESLVMVATEVAQDPLLDVLSERADDGNVADLIARSTTLSEVLAGHFETAFRDLGAGYLRAGLRPADAARFVLSIALGLLLRLIPVDDAEQVRRYLRVFVLPALAADPPPVTPVFTPLH